MEAEREEQQCSTSNSIKPTDLTEAKSFTQHLTHHLRQILSSNSSETTIQVQHPNSSNQPSTIMSGNNSASSTNWNDVLKQTSAIGILRPDLVFPSGGGSSSGSSGSSGNAGGSSGSSSGGASGGSASRGSSGGAKR